MALQHSESLFPEYAVSRGQSGKRMVRHGEATNDLVFSAYANTNAEVFPKILDLYLRPRCVVADVTYGKGAFWKRVPDGRYRLWATDILDGVDCRGLPYADAELSLLDVNLSNRRNRLAESVNQRNLSCFEQQVREFDVWADDLKVGLEQQIKGIDGEIKEDRRTMATAPTLETKLGLQKQQRKLEHKRYKLRCEPFDGEDHTRDIRNDLISDLA